MFMFTAGALEAAAHYPRLAVSIFFITILGTPIVAIMTSPTPMIPAYRAGDSLAMKLDGGKVMVLSAECRPSCEYWVRAATKTGYQNFWAAEYELTR